MRLRDLFETQSPALEVGDILDLTPSWPNYQHLLGRIESINGSKYKILIVVAKPSEGYKKPPLTVGQTIASDYKFIRNRKVIAKSG